MQLGTAAGYLAVPANIASVIFIVFASLLLTVASHVGIFGIPRIVIRCNPWPTS